DYYCGAWDTSLSTHIF
nr:immunoglobulin light chain junction region [Macaca mulatta]MOY17598.1 immunoglobulin light chain junction region [Macaca mulatta]